MRTLEQELRAWNEGSGEIVEGRHKIRQLIIVFCIKLNASHKIQLVFREKSERNLGL